MNWFVFMGNDDWIFEAGECQAEYETVFSDLGIYSALKYDVIAAGTEHEEDSRFFDVMLAFINDGDIKSISDFERRWPPRGIIAWLLVFAACIALLHYVF